MYGIPKGKEELQVTTGSSLKKA